MIVAIPKFGETVAPCFEAARVFVITEIEGDHMTAQRVSECQGCEGFGRVQLLRDRKVNILICNGIKGFYRDLLQAAGIEVIADVTVSVTNALSLYVGGQFGGKLPESEPVAWEEDIPLEDLVCWTQELFTAHGYAVKPGAECAQFPIDLVAEIECPVCHRPVRVAICCGAHTYRPEQEIELLHLAAAAGYHAQVYVRSATPGVERRCHEYGVELIDPDARFANRDHLVQGHIPILQAVVSGHEAASNDGGGR